MGAGRTESAAAVSLAPPAATPGPMSETSGVTVLVTTGSAGVTVRSASGVHTYPLVKGVAVTIDGKKSSVAALNPGAKADITRNGAGAITAIKATLPAVTPPLPTGKNRASHAGTVSGILIGSASASGFVIKTTSGVRTFVPASTTLVARAGAPSSFAALRNRDRLTVTTDAAGTVARVAALAGVDSIAAGTLGSSSSPAVSGTNLDIVENGVVHQYSASGVDLYRNNMRANLNEMKQGDKARLTFSPTGVLTRVDATGSDGARPAAATAPQTTSSTTLQGSSGLSIGPIIVAALVAFLLLILLRRLRRRHV